MVCPSCPLLSVSSPAFFSSAVRHILLDFICSFSPSFVSIFKLSPEIVRRVALLWPESLVQVKARTGVVLRWNISCPHLFLVQHYLCWIYYFNFFHLFTAFVAPLSQFLQNPFVFLFYIANFGATVAYSHSFASFVPYFTQWFLSQILMCQLKYFSI